MAYQVRGVIEGTCPLLFGKMTDAARSSVESGSTGGRPSPSERVAEVAERYYWDEQGCYLPAWNFKQSLLGGCKAANLKRGKASLATFLKATVFAEGDLRFGQMEPDFILESTGKRPPRTGGAVIIKYPAFNTGWRLPFVLNVIDERIRAEDVRRSLEEAGLLVGLGPWRPEYGRFVLKEWAVTD